jgi:hypothetical protein
MDTPMMARFFAPGLGAAATVAVEMKMMSLDDIAEQIVYLLCEDSEHVVGVNLTVGTVAP